MESVIFTLLGKDKPGIMEAVSRAVRQLQGNWLASNFAHMGGHFTGFVEVKLPSENIRPLLDKLDAMPELNIRLVQGQTSDRATRQVSLEILGNDKPGIVQELTSVLHQFQLNILRFSSNCEAAPNWGGNLFKAQVVIEIPEDFDLGPLSQSLEKIANDLVVDIDWH
ncbi:glycine cleavage system transcriptional repressor [Bowmanella dokdonensis]|uniref:Glycine cleavage system transcriptional repressor n=1 Tax=Bowmanella dokdonensis TaxID=751969 RepID=A0A939DQY7_9ALTE|nr:ACT domain-containing protein [Bowmanella dokdonensis]MBN7826311.1 glycine cleavage system protein R [Bowmanella dokdonensis]